MTIYDRIIRKTVQRLLRRTRARELQILIDDILSALDSPDALWIGKNPARHDMTDGQMIVDPARVFRAPSSYHQAFDITFLVEYDLATIKQWPLVLDEALRTLRPGGVLVLRTSQTTLLSIFQLANFIEKWTGGRYTMLDQVSDAGKFIISLRLAHDDPRPSSTSSWAFCLVTDGRKPAAVAKFVDSVLALEHRDEASVEILICGPDSVMTDLGEKAGHVRLVNQPTKFAQNGWITRKKNLLVEASQSENILIAHDRFTLDSMFLPQMRTFGGDFDVVSPRQKTVDGNPLPDWVMVSDVLNWATPGWMEDGDYHPLTYINGGVLIAKTYRLRQVRWSEMLFWAQAEDVDLTRRLSDVGVTPRLAPDVKLFSETPRRTFLEGFELLPWVDGLYPLTHRPDWQAHQPVGPFGIACSPSPMMALGAEAVLGGENAHGAAIEKGLIFPQTWGGLPDGFVWKGMDDPYFSMKLTDSPATGVLVMEFGSEAEAAQIAQVRLNSIITTVTQRHGAKVEIDLIDGVLTGSDILHVWIERLSTQPLVLKRVALYPAASGQIYALDRPLTFQLGSPDTAFLAQGWHPTETWGVWADSSQADVVVKIESPPGPPLTGFASIQAFCAEGVAVQVITLTSDGAFLGSWVLSSTAASLDITFSVPRPVSGDRVRLSFTASRLTSPKEAGLGPDFRALGVGLKSISLTYGE